MAAVYRSWGYVPEEPVRIGEWVTLVLRRGAEPSAARPRSGAREILGHRGDLAAVQADVGELPVREAEERLLGGAGVAPGGEGVERVLGERDGAERGDGPERDRAGDFRREHFPRLPVGPRRRIRHPRARHISGGARLCTIAIPAFPSCISCKGVKSLNHRLTTGALADVLSSCYDGRARRQSRTDSQCASSESTRACSAPAGASWTSRARASATWRTGSAGRTGADLAARLCSLHEALTAVMRAWLPEAAAVEQTFVNKDAAGTLKLGQARGIALLVPAQAGLSVAEYAPNAVKKVVVGVGHADKAQVAAHGAAAAAGGRAQRAGRGGRAGDRALPRASCAVPRAARARRWRAPAHDRQGERAARLSRRRPRADRHRRGGLHRALLRPDAGGDAGGRARRWRSTPTSWCART